MAAKMNEMSKLSRDLGNKIQNAATTFSAASRISGLTVATKGRIRNKVALNKCHYGERYGSTTGAAGPSLCVAVVGFVSV